MIERESAVEKQTDNLNKNDNNTTLKSMLNQQREDENKRKFKYFMLNSAFKNLRGGLVTESNNKQITC